MAEGDTSVGVRSLIRPTIIRCNRYFINICELTFLSSSNVYLTGVPTLDRPWADLCRGGTN